MDYFTQNKCPTLGAEHLLLLSCLRNGLEEVSQRNLPRVELSAASILKSVLGGIPCIHFTCLAKGEVVVSLYLQLAHNGSTYTDVGAEVRRLQCPFRNLGTCYAGIAIAAKFEAELRTSKGEYLGNRAQTKTIADVDRDLE